MYRLHYVGTICGYKALQLLAPFSWKAIPYHDKTHHTTTDHSFPFRPSLAVVSVVSVCIVLHAMNGSSKRTQYMWHLTSVFLRLHEILDICLSSSCFSTFSLFVANFIFMH